MKKLHQNQSGVIHHLGLIVLIFAVLAGLGFAGMRVWQARESAKAESWDQVSYYFMNPGEFRVYACKVDEQMAKVFIRNDSNHTLSVSTGTNVVTIKPNSKSGPYTSKIIGVVSWNNISNESYSLEDNLVSSC